MALGAYPHAHTHAVKVISRNQTSASWQLFRIKKSRKAKIYNETVRSDNEDEMEDKEAEEMDKSLKLQHLNVQQVIHCFSNRFLPTRCKFMV